MNTTKPVKIPHDWRHKAYTYYAVSYTSNGHTKFLKNPYVGELGPASIAFEFTHKRAAKHWMRYWMNHNTAFTNPNISKVRGLPKAERQMVELLGL